MNDPQHDNELFLIPRDMRLPRRTFFKWLAAATAVMQLGDVSSLGGAEYVIGSAPPAVANGYGTDPKVTQIYNPGDVWPLIMSPAQKAAATALADIIIPADELGPAASSVQVPDFVDEWVSAPYPGQVHDRSIILPGLDWLDAESQKRYQAVFASLQSAQQTAICNAICYVPKAAAEFKKPAQFFSRFRSIAAAAYYATPAGWKAIGYVGNVPMVTFDGPPDEILTQLGVEQTVK